MLSFTLTKDNPPKREDVTKELAVMIEMLEKHYDKKSNIVCNARGV